MSNPLRLSPPWLSLEDIATAQAATPLRTRFAADPERFQNGQAF